MAEAIKFTDEEVNSINQLRQEVANIFTQLGQVAIEKKRRISEIEGVESQLLQKHAELQGQEQELFKGLNEKYGDGNFDPATGEFTPVSKEESTVTEG